MEHRYTMVKSISGLNFQIDDENGIVAIFKNETVARMFLAAPDLVEALEDAINNKGGWRNRAKLALSKALDPAPATY